MNTGYNTILLVEDNPSDVFLIQRAFSRATPATTIQVVTDGAQAVDYLAGNEPYADRECYPFPVLMILDLKLPRKSGFEVLEWLQRQPALNRLPVVVLSSSDQPGDINRAYDLDVNSYLVKPVVFDDLLDMVNTIGLYWLALNEGPEIQD